MTIVAKGFASIQQRNRHFQLHGHDFGASHAEEYERFAIAFWDHSVSRGVYEHTRSGGDKLRYDSNTDAFGVLDVTGVIRTYFKPVPCSSLPGHMRAAEKRAGRCHGHANNLIYYKTECKRW